MIEVIIPTYKHAQMISYLCEKSLSQYNGELFKFIILDSSPDDSTEVIIKQYPFIAYKRYDSKISADDKIINYLKQEDIDYFYLMGDGRVVDFTLLENALIKNDYQKYAIIDLEESIRIGYLGIDGDKKIGAFNTFDNDIEFAKRYFSHLTFWGASIVNTNFFKLGLTDDFIYGLHDKDKSIIKSFFGWWYPCCLFNACSKDQNNFLLASVYLDNIFFGNPYKQYHAHTWTNGESYYYLAFKMFNLNIDSLPKRYDEIKDLIISNFRKDALATRRNQFFYRMEGTITRKNNRKYEVYIKRIPGYYEYMELLAFVPVPALKTFYNAGRSIKHIIKGRK